jgi:hypothetical protein
VKRWTTIALVGAAIALLMGLISFRLTRAPDGARASSLFPDAQDTRAQVESIRARMERKRQAAGELIAGRQSLLQTAADFRDLDALGPHVPIRNSFPRAASDDEGYCLSVLEYVYKEAPPERAEELTGLYTDEMNARLRDGTLVMPAPQSAVGP